VIIKVVEIVEKPDVSFYDEASSSINKDLSEKFALCETYLNTEHIISFREIDVKPDNLPKGLDKRQKFTHITLSKARAGVVVVNSPSEIQCKISRREKELLKG
jgi:hypothetical protein